MRLILYKKPGIMSIVFWSSVIIKCVFYSHLLIFRGSLFFHTMKIKTKVHAHGFQPFRFVPHNHRYITGRRIPSRSVLRQGIMKFLLILPGKGLLPLRQTFFPLVIHRVNGIQPANLGSAEQHHP